MFCAWLSICPSWVSIWPSWLTSNPPGGIPGIPGMPVVSVPVIVLRIATLFPDAITSSTTMCMSGVISRICVNIAIAPALSSAAPRP